jgi:Rps23 Pro-64 3,4-dihydroxylase Tpa1-like proline 4-hydroxylase
MTFAQSEPPKKEVRVKLLLAGGHEYNIFLAPDSPMLQVLAKTLLGRSAKTNDSALLQIPLDGGHSVLCCPSEHLIGIITEPPLYIQSPETKPTVAHPHIESAQVDPLISRYALMNNFFTEAEHQELLEYVAAKQSEFVPTTTSTKATNYRLSMVLHKFPRFRELMLEKVRAILPDVLAKLNIPAFPIADIESQLTAHNDGNFYKIHNDSGSPDTATRFFTYVYYFYQEPKAFTGGELKIYDSKIQGNYYVQSDTFKLIEPINNSVVFFLSRYMHEVLPVSCPSKQFMDGRFTINGWVRRAD